MFKNKRILVTGGTGSLGKTLVRRLLTGELGQPESVTVFSRDEAKQNDMRMAYHNCSRPATDEIIYQNAGLLKFVIGDVRDFHSLASVLQDKDIVVNAAALKQVPTCEYFPYEAVRTNVGGAENIVRAIREHKLPVAVVVGVSTDKACHPVNVMGMTKAIQERIFISANLTCPKTRFVCVRYGNVLASRGSVIPLFHDQIKRGGPVTLTIETMTRFLISLNQAVDVIFAAVQHGNRGDTYIPQIPSVRMRDLADALIGNRDVRVVSTGIRPGEKLDEILVSQEEVPRTVNRGSYFVIQSILPEVPKADFKVVIRTPYSSADNLMSYAEVCQLLVDNRLRVEDAEAGELLR